MPEINAMSLLYQEQHQERGEVRGDQKSRGRAKKLLASHGQPGQGRTAWPPPGPARQEAVLLSVGRVSPSPPG